MQTIQGAYTYPVEYDRTFNAYMLYYERATLPSSPDPIPSFPDPIPSSSDPIPSSPDPIPIPSESVPQFLSQEVECPPPATSNSAPVVPPEKLGYPHGILQDVHTANIQYMHETDMSSPVYAGFIANFLRVLTRDRVRDTTPQSSSADVREGWPGEGPLSPVSISQGVRIGMLFLYNTSFHMRYPAADVTGCLCRILDIYPSASRAFFEVPLPFLLLHCPLSYYVTTTPSSMALLPFLLLRHSLSYDITTTPTPTPSLITSLPPPLLLRHSLSYYITTLSSMTSFPLPLLCCHYPLSYDLTSLSPMTSLPLPLL